MISEVNSIQRKRFSPLASFSICFSLAVILFNAFQWNLVPVLTVFLIGPFLLCSWIILAILIILSLVYLLRQIRIHPKQAFIPLVINVTTILILLFVPFTNFWLAFEFRLNKSDYDKVVEMVKNEEIQPDNFGIAKLPSEYAHVSQGGDILIEKGDGVTSVFFFTFIGVLDNFSGFMYRSNDMPPPEGYMGGDWFQIKRKEPNWFFCASK